MFACFSYEPKGAEETYALVGKGIVYDSGGMTLKGRTMMPGQSDFTFSEFISILLFYCFILFFVFHFPNLLTLHFLAVYCDIFDTFFSVKVAIFDACCLQ